VQLACTLCMPRLLDCWPNFCTQTQAGLSKPDCPRLIFSGHWLNISCTGWVLIIKSTVSSEMRDQSSVSCYLTLSLATVILPRCSSSRFFLIRFMLGCYIKYSSSITVKLLNNCCEPNYVMRKYAVILCLAYSLYIKGSYIDRSSDNNLPHCERVREQSGNLCFLVKWR